MKTKEELDRYFIMFSSYERFGKFLEIKDELDDKLYWYALGDVYVGSDDLYYLKEDVKEAFLEDRPHRDKLMNKDELEVYNNLPDKVKIYRGMSIEEFKSEDFGISWSLSQEKAEFFAYTYGRNHSTNHLEKIVHELEVPKCLIYAYFDERDEQEVIYIH